MAQIKFLIATLVVLVFGIKPANAGQTPEEFYSAMTKKIQTSGAPILVLDYIDWETAFGKLTKDNKAQFKVTSPSELREHYELMFSDPRSFVMKQVAPETPRTPEKVQEWEKIIADLKKIPQGVSETKYEVGKSVVDGDTALLDVKRTYSGKTDEIKVPLLRKGEQWFLPSLEALNGQQ